ncbi:CDP-alcohol phosphatidyltransferase family protein [Streptomyces sp. FIT100]|uniref:CDP-alcohol phosphatidyltransferase family protein n=1 Tax=Streptomyces sp. FIT100 TaxID=2837956 RepID=UPI0021C66A09|nr:CDP-alcohol phosphatidyltransferase family protein [Streptomyces sp. FIT100]UUN31555.1 CDP-alcohol phosphatidyltransferase family protein [Streptomyces sp. FIT100]
MSTAILTGPPVPGSPLEGDLRSLGFDVRVAAGADETAELLAAVPAAERVALVDPRFVGHVHALRLALTDPRFPASAVPGAVTAQAEARPALLAALKAAPAADTARVADALGAEGTTPHRPELGSLVATVPDDPQARNEARQAVAAVDDEDVRLRSAVKARDGFFTTFFISPYSRYIARWCARRGLTPNQVTTASLLTALIAAGCAATGTRGGFVAAGVLLLFSFVLDCTDGQLARYSLQYSTMGAWLDATFDRAKEYAYYAGLALGAARGGDDVWALALGAMILQTCRHVVDFSFNEANHDATAAGKSVTGSPTAALSEKLDSVGWTVWVRRMIVLPIGERWAMIAVLTAVATPRIVFYALLIGCGFAATYTTAGRVLRSLTRRARRTDRAAQALADLADSGTLAESFAAAFADTARRLPGFAPLAVAAAGGAAVTGAAAFAPVGSWWPVVGAALYVTTSGFAVARPLKGALDWLVPPVFRAVEYGVILLLAARSEVNGALPAAFGLVAAVAYHHYDTVYRIRGGTGAPPAWLVRTIGGHEGRTLAVAVLAALLASGGTGFPVALTVLAVAVALVVLVESIRFWVSAGAPAVHDEGEPA